MDELILGKIKRSKEIEEVSLDEWAPSPKAPAFRLPGEWRKKKNTEASTTMAPTADDVRKIKAHLKAGTCDDDILDAFNISESVLADIGAGSYKVVQRRTYVDARKAGRWRVT